MADERLLSTSFRFEVYNSHAKTLRKVLALQNSRIKTDELLASRIKVEKEAGQEMEVSRWMANFVESNKDKREKNEAELLKSEAKLRNKELVMVRRAQLKNLLAEESQKYEKELNAFGKAFYKKRI